MDENAILFGKHIRLGEGFYNLWSSWMSTTRWRYDQGKCIESCDVGHAHIRLPFFFFSKHAKYRKPTFSNSSQIIADLLIGVSE